MEDSPEVNVGSPKAQEVGSNLQAALLAGEIDSLLRKFMSLILEKKQQIFNI